MADAEHRGKIAFITGGGRGFGKAFGHALAARGAHAVLADIDAEVAAAAAAEIVAAGGAASSVDCDVAEEAQAKATIDKVAAQHGGIDILINNAGLHSASYNAPMTQMGLPKIRKLFDVNIMGVIICTLAAKQAMSGRAGACIINISSSASYSSGNAYGISKLAVRGITMAFAREFVPDGIRVNAIAPGLIFTDTIRNELPKDMIGRVLKQQLLTREGEERDVVEAMLYLVSSRASFVTGETLRVSGGYTLAI
jgi:3-oxoacyl-[acyl-carrier protein] reductase